MSRQVVDQHDSQSGYRKLFQQGIVAGFGWAIGVTFGFVLLSAVFAFTLQALGGLPVIGSWTASIVEATQEQLERRSVIAPYSP